MRYHHIAEGVAYQTHEFSVFENPTLAIVRGLKAKAKHDEGLRALVGQSVIYVWDGYFLTHYEACVKLGMHPHTVAAIHVWNGHVEWDVSDYDLTYEDDAEERLKNHYVWITRNPLLKRFYGGDVPLMADDGSNDFDPIEAFNWIEFDLGTDSRR